MKHRKYWMAGVGGILAVLALVVLVGDPSGVALFLGRFHPLIVHLPIGVLLLAGLLEGAARWPRFAGLRDAVPFVLLAGAVAAVAAVVSGLLLASGGGYDEDVLSWHKRLGIVLAVVAVAAAAVRLVPARVARLPQRLAGGLVAGVLVLVVATGHFGGMLTHGSGYLTDYLPDAVRVAMAMPPRGQAGAARFEHIDEAGLYADLIQPILDARCVACHGEEKQRGDLRLDTPDAIGQGGEEGPVLVAGNAAASELVRRILLPPEHDDHMPPLGRPQLSVAEAELLRWWIDRGASFDAKVGDTEPTEPVEAILEAYGGGAERRTGVFALDVGAASPAAVAALEAAGATVAPLAQDEALLQVTFPTGADAPGAEALAALEGVARQVTWLDLGRTAAGDEVLAAAARMPHLTRLHLEHTPITDAGLAHLAGHAYLEYLNLVGTAVTDAGLAHLAGLPRLRHLYLWQTQAGAAGVEQLRTALPGLKVDTGLADTSAVAAPDSTAAAPAP